MNRVALILAVGLTLVGPARAQLGPCATPLGSHLPDLIIDRRALQTNKLLSTEFFDSNSCELVEGCVRATGLRRLLRFTTSTPNIGIAALVIGDPSQCALLFHFSECHGHYHFSQFADYRFWTRAGFRMWRKNRDSNEPAASTDNAGLLESLRQSGDLFAGRKQGFCLVDDSPYNTREPAAFNNCTTNQGISVGWEDVYRADIACQFIDVTGAAAGRYILEVEVNPDRVLPESSYLNNSVHITIKIPKPAP